MRKIVLMMLIVVFGLLFVGCDLPNLCINPTPKNNSGVQSFTTETTNKTTIVCKDSNPGGNDSNDEISAPTEGSGSAVDSVVRPAENVGSPKQTEKLENRFMTMTDDELEDFVNKGKPDNPSWLVWKKINAYIRKYEISNGGPSRTRNYDSVSITENEWKNRHAYYHNNVDSPRIWQTDEILNAYYKRKNHVKDRYLSLKELVKRKEAKEDRSDFEELVLIGETENYEYAKKKYFELATYEDRCIYESHKDDDGVHSIRKSLYKTFSKYNVNPDECEDLVWDRRGKVTNYMEAFEMHVPWSDTLYHTNMY